MHDKGMAHRNITLEAVKLKKREKKGLKVMLGGLERAISLSSQGSLSMKAGRRFASDNSSLTTEQAQDVYTLGQLAY